MKVKHILAVVLILGIAASAMVFGLPFEEPVEGPELLHSFDGGAEHRLKQPTYAITDKKGRIFVADAGNHRIAILDHKGKFVNEIGGPESEKPLYYPYGLGFIGRDRLLVADIQAGVLLEYSIKGEFKKIWHTGLNFEPAGIFVTPDLSVYVSDLAGKQILVFNEQGKLLKSIKPQNVELGAPQGIWVNKDGTLWVADSGNYNVKLLNESGSLNSLFDGGPDRPLSMAKGLAVDKKGRIYVSDTLSNVVRVFDEEGNSFGTIGPEEGSKPGLQFPVGLYVDDKDRLYIADQGNNRIQVWNFK